MQPLLDQAADLAGTVGHGPPKLVVLTRWKLKRDLHHVVVLFGKHDLCPNEISYLVDSLSSARRHEGKKGVTTSVTSRW